MKRELVKGAFDAGDESESARAFQEALAKKKVNV
jgi:hypothetical protein